MRKVLPNACAVLILPGRLLKAKRIPEKMSKLNYKINYVDGLAQNVKIMDD